MGCSEAPPESLRLTGSVHRLSASSAGVNVTTSSCLPDVSLLPSAPTRLSADSWALYHRNEHGLALLLQTSG